MKFQDKTWILEMEQGLEKGCGVLRQSVGS